MFALTASHFETHNSPSSEDFTRRSFCEWVDMIRIFYGDDPCDRALELLEEEYADYPGSEPGRLLWLAPQEENFELFVKILDKVKNEFSIV